MGAIGEDGVAAHDGAPVPGATASARAAAAPGLAQRRRLRQVLRSAGWPVGDGLETELLSAGLLGRQVDAAGRTTLYVTDSGIDALAQARLCRQTALDPHELLVARVARQMQRAHRIVWRRLALRAPLPAAAADSVAADAVAPREVALEGVEVPAPPPAPASVRWVMAMPDVYSIRPSTLEDCVEPFAHEIKVRRADLLADLRKPDKGAAYRALSSQCWYVLARGIGEPEEVPSEFGVLWADAVGFEVARPAPRRALRLPFAVWVALARAPADAAPEDDGQDGLGLDHAAGVPREGP